MRNDMSKIAVERPRRGHGSSYHDVRAAEKHVRDFDDYPAHQGIRRPFRKDYKTFSENFNPLKRYLLAQVGRPWNDVHSEICANIDRNNTVQDHLLGHVLEQIELHVYEQNGKLYVNEARWGHTNQIREVPKSACASLWSLQLFVDPRDGVLKVCEHVRTTQARSVYATTQRMAFDPSSRRWYVPGTCKIISLKLEYHLIEGIWFAVDIAMLPAPTEHIICHEEENDIDKRWERVMRGYHMTRDGEVVLSGIGTSYGYDVLKKETVRIEADARKRGFSFPEVAIAYRKRTLSHKELKRAGLQNH